MQYIAPLPFLIADTSTSHPYSKKNRDFSPTTRKFFGIQLKVPSLLMILWKYKSIELPVAILVNLFRIYWLFTNWRTSPAFEQLAYSTILLTVQGIGHAAYSCINSNIPEIAYLINQLLKIVEPHTDPNAEQVYFEKTTQHSVKEAFIYGFFSLTTIYPFILSVVPIVGLREILQLVAASVSFHNIKDHLWIVNVLALLHNFIMISYGAINLTLTLLIIILALESIIMLSLKVACPRMILYSNEIKTLKSFIYCVKCFKILQIVISLSNNIASDFLAVLVGLGILAASCGGFVMLVLHEGIPLIIYLSVSTIFFLGQAVNLLLVGLAAIPNQNGNGFIRTWRGELIRKREKKILMACPEIGFSIGFVRNIKYHTALSICDTIISFTATVALVKINE